MCVCVSKGLVQNAVRTGELKHRYDLTVGTSERGTVTVDDADFALPTYRHALIVFGGVQVWGGIGDRIFPWNVCKQFSCYSSPGYENIVGGTQVYRGAGSFVTVFFRIFLQNFPQLIHIYLHGIFCRTCSG